METNEKTVANNVVGYHCGTVQRCRDFIENGTPDWAQGEVLWLGLGMYYWDNLGNAEGWRRSLKDKYGCSDTTIVSADISTDNMIDLTNPIERYMLGLIIDRANKTFDSKKRKQEHFLGDILDYIFSTEPYRGLVGPVNVIKAIGTHKWEGIHDRQLDDMCWRRDPHLIFNACVEYCVKKKRRDDKTEKCLKEREYEMASGIEILGRVLDCFDMIDNLPPNEKQRVVDDYWDFVEERDKERNNISYSYDPLLFDEEPAFIAPIRAKSNAISCFHVEALEDSDKAVSIPVVQMGSISFFVDQTIPDMQVEEMKKSIPRHNTADVPLVPSDRGSWDTRAA